MRVRSQDITSLVELLEAHREVSIQLSNLKSEAITLEVEVRAESSVPLRADTKT